MKTFGKLLLVTLLIAALFSCAALAEDAEDTDYAELNPDSLVYDSNWVSDDTMIHSYCEDGGFKVTVIRTATLNERITWEYSPLFDADTRTLVDDMFGSKTVETLDDYGNVLSSNTEYEDGSAVFSLDAEGRLLWADAKEDAGKGVTYEKIGRFEGHYQCDRAEIEISWDDDHYGVYIQWGDSASVTYDWIMTGVYNQEKNTLEALGMESRTEYDANGEVVSVEDLNEEGCSAVFSFNEDGGLLWTGTEGADTEGMVFMPYDPDLITD